MRSLPARGCWIKFIDGSHQMVLGESEDIAKPADASLGSKTICSRLLSNNVLRKKKDVHTLMKADCRGECCPENNCYCC